MWVYACKLSFWCSNINRLTLRLSLSSVSKKKHWAYYRKRNNDTHTQKQKNSVMSSIRTCEKYTSFCVASPLCWTPAALSEHHSHLPAWCTGLSPRCPRSCFLNTHTSTHTHTHRQFRAEQNESYTTMTMVMAEVMYCQTERNHKYTIE